MGYIFQIAYDNDVAALKPEWWALEGLRVLEEQIVAPNLVNMDYNNHFASAGDVVHVNKPGTFVAKHKIRGSSTTVQDANASDTQVKLDQHLEVTIVLDDLDLQKSLPDLRQYFLMPQLRAIAEGIDAAVVGTGAQFIANSAGTVGTALTDDAVIDLGRVFDDNNNVSDGRYLIVGSAGKADLLKIDRFSDADKSGQPSKFISGEIGSIMGFRTFMSQTVGRSLAAGMTTTPEVADGAKAKGATVLAIDTAATSHTVGTWLTIAGVPGVYRAATAVTGSSTTSLTVSPGLRGAMADNAVITFYEAAAALSKGTFAAGVIKVITDGYTSAAEIPQRGSGITIDNSLTSGIYTVTAVEGTWVNSTTEITLVLNRPLDEAVANDKVINVMPVGGSYNMAFCKDAITLVNRPLAPAAAGVAASVQNNGAFSLRATIGYDMDIMRHRITLDTLIGVKVLDVAKGAVLLN